ncbi:hypothetical protein D3C83_204570 [compost metagenome]
MRINALERELNARNMGLDLGGWLQRLVPSDVREHLVAAQRENMLAARAYLDRMIDGLELAEDKAEGSRRRVTVE